MAFNPRVSLARLDMKRMDVEDDVIVDPTARRLLCAAPPLLMKVEAGATIFTTPLLLPKLCEHVEFNKAIRCEPEKVLLTAANLEEDVWLNHPTNPRVATAILFKLAIVKIYHHLFT